VIANLLSNHDHSRRTQRLPQLPCAPWPGPHEPMRCAAWDSNRFLSLDGALLRV